MISKISSAISNYGHYNLLFAKTPRREEFDLFYLPRHRLWPDDITFKCESLNIELGDADTIRSYMSWMHLYIMGHFDDPEHDQVYLSKLSQYFIVNCPTIYLSEAEHKENTAPDNEKRYIDDQDSSLLFDVLKKSSIYNGKIKIKMDAELKREPQVFHNQAFDFAERSQPHLPECSVILDDKEFRDWYMSEQNLRKARAYFGFICINLLRVPFRSVDNSLDRFNRIIPAEWDCATKPPKMFPKFARLFMEKFRIASKADPAMIRRPIKLLSKYQSSKVDRHGKIMLYPLFQTSLCLGIGSAGLFNLSFVVGLASEKYKEFLNWLALKTVDQNLLEQIAMIHQFGLEMKCPPAEIGLKLSKFSVLFTPSFFNMLTGAEEPKVSSFIAGIGGDKSRRTEIGMLKEFQEFDKYFELGVKAQEELELECETEEFLMQGKVMENICIPIIESYQKLKGLKLRLIGLD